MTLLARYAFYAVNAAILIYLVAPIVIVVGTAFTTTGYPTFPPQGFTLRWFERVMTVAGFPEAIWLSTLLAACSTAVSLVLGTFTALALGRWRMRGHASFSAFVMLPVLFPGTVLGLALLVFFSWIGLAGSFTGLVIAHSLVATPFVIRMVMASLGEFDPAVEEAARNLGAGWWRTFFQITLALIRPGLFAGAMFAFIISFDELVVTLFLSGPRLETVPIKVFTYLEFNSDPTISAISTILIFAWLIIGIPFYSRLMSANLRA